MDPVVLLAALLLLLTPFVLRRRAERSVRPIRVRAEYGRFRRSRD